MCRVKGQLDITICIRRHRDLFEDMAENVPNDHVVILTLDEQLGTQVGVVVVSFLVLGYRYTSWMQGIGQRRRISCIVGGI